MCNAEYMESSALLRVSVKRELTNGMAKPSGRGNLILCELRGPQNGLNADSSVRGCVSGYIIPEVFEGPYWLNFQSQPVAYDCFNLRTLCRMTRHNIPEELKMKFYLSFHNSTVSFLTVVRHIKLILTPTTVVSFHNVCLQRAQRKCNVTETKKVMKLLRMK